MVHIPCRIHLLHHIVEAWLKELIPEKIHAPPWSLACNKVFCARTKVHEGVERAGRERWWMIEERDRSSISPAVTGARIYR